jgi:hypothetical protein
MNRPEVTRLSYLLRWRNPENPCFYQRIFVERYKCVIEDERQWRWSLHFCTEQTLPTVTIFVNSITQQSIGDIDTDSIQHRYPLSVTIQSYRSAFNGRTPPSPSGRDQDPFHRRRRRGSHLP